MLSNDTKKIINEPFNEKLIRTKRGFGNSTLRYVEGCEYIRRLNEAFGHDWDFRVLESTLHTYNHVTVKGELTVKGPSGNIVKQAFGGATIKCKKGSNHPIQLGDDMKSAATDALKKASSLLGIGLHLYGDYGEIWEEEKRSEKAALRDEVSGLFKLKEIHSKGPEASQKRAELLLDAFGYVTWKEIDKNLSIEQIKEGLVKLKEKLGEEK